ncbi:MAG: hypothetical protein H7835_19725, partial [Magnetococcus sp. XQGC-1]
MYVEEFFLLAEKFFVLFIFRLKYKNFYIFFHSFFSVMGPPGGFTEPNPFSVDGGWHPVDETAASAPDATDTPPATEVGRDDPRPPGNDEAVASPPAGEVVEETDEESSGFVSEDFDDEEFLSQPPPEHPFWRVNRVKKGGCKKNEGDMDPARVMDAAMRRNLPTSKGDGWRARLTRVTGGSQGEGEEEGSQQVDDEWGSQQVGDEGGSQQEGDEGCSQQVGDDGVLAKEGSDGEGGASRSTDGPGGCVEGGARRGGDGSAGGAMRGGDGANGGAGAVGVAGAVDVAGPSGSGVGGSDREVVADGSISARWKRLPPAWKYLEPLPPVVPARRVVVGANRSALVLPEGQGLFSGCSRSSSGGLQSGSGDMERVVRVWSRAQARLALSTPTVWPVCHITDERVCVAMRKVAMGSDPELVFYLK